MLKNADNSQTIILACHVLGDLQYPEEYQCQTDTQWEYPKL